MKSLLCTLTCWYVFKDKKWVSRLQPYFANKKTIHVFAIMQVNRLYVNHFCNLRIFYWRIFFFNSYSLVRIHVHKRDKYCFNKRIYLCIHSLHQIHDLKINLVYINKNTLTHAYNCTQSYEKKRYEIGHRTQEIQQNVIYLIVYG